MTGRFIANAAMQLRKRAASLCYEELKEYKVSSLPSTTSVLLQHCTLPCNQSWIVLLQRSKILNVLKAPAEAPAPGSRPSSASYLIPAVPNHHNVPHSSEPFSKNGQSNSKPAPQNVGQQQDAAPGSQPGDNTQMPPHHTPDPGQDTSCASAPPQASTQALPASVLDLRCNEVSVAASVAGTSSNAQEAARMSTDTEAMHCLGDPAAKDLPRSSPPASNDKPHTLRMQPGADKQPWLPFSNQQKFMSSWSQGASQPLQASEHWAHDSSPAALNYSQAKLGCAHNFPFSKQPCAVMW